MVKRNNQKLEQHGIKQPTEAQVKVAFYVVAFLLCIAVYNGIAHNYLYNDDFLWMSQARYEMEPGNILSQRVIGFFRPLINVSYYVMEKVNPGNIPLYYYTNLLLHFINTILLFHLLCLLLRNQGVAAATSLLFAITSMHASAVLWVSARTGLISSLFLLSSLMLFVRRSAGWKSTALALVLYALSLMSKETAVVGLPLAALVYFFVRSRDRISLSRQALFGYVALTLAYLVTRHLVIGGLSQSNWDFGAHALRNAAGGVLYQYYPWALRSLLNLPTMFAESNNPVWPELQALPFVLFFILLAWNTARHKDMLFALAWVLICLAPVSFFTFRFFSTVMITHDRYYYLSSIGVCLSIVLALWILWEFKKNRTVCRTVAIAAFLAIALGEYYNMDRRKDNWRMVTGNYKTAVETATNHLDDYPDYSTCAIERSPIPFKYLKHALKLERPQWAVEEVAGREEAGQYRPCLHVIFMVDGRELRSAAAPLQ
jgi:hypothetical protein